MLDQLGRRVPASTPRPGEGTRSCAHVCAAAAAAKYCQETPRSGFFSVVVLRRGGGREGEDGAGGGIKKKGGAGVIRRPPRYPTWFWAPATTRPGWTPRSLRCPRTHCRDAPTESWTFPPDSPRP